MATTNLPFRDGASLQLVQGVGQARKIRSYGYFDGRSEIRFLLYKGYDPPKHNNDSKPTFQAGPPIWEERDFLAALAGTHRTDIPEGHAPTPGLLHADAQGKVEEWVYVKGNAADYTGTPPESDEHASAPRSRGGHAPEFPEDSRTNPTGPEKKSANSTASMLHTLQVYPGFYTMVLDDRTKIGFLAVLDVGTIGDTKQTVEWFNVNPRHNLYGDRIGGRKSDGRRHGEPWTLELAKSWDSPSANKSIWREFRSMIKEDSQLSVISCTTYAPGDMPDPL